MFFFIQNALNDNNMAHFMNKIYTRTLGIHSLQFGDHLLQGRHLNIRKRCLAFGAGPWVLKVAPQYPNVTFHGIHTLPIVHNLDPTTVITEVDDLNLDLQHLHGRYDAVHCRDAAIGVVHLPRFIGECINALTPGGVFEFEDIDPHLYHPGGHVFLADTTSLLIDTAPSWTVPSPPPTMHYFVRLLAARSFALQLHGTDTGAISRVGTWLVSHPDVEIVNEVETFVNIQDPSSRDVFMVGFVPLICFDMLTEFLKRIIGTAVIQLRLCGTPETVIEELKGGAVQEVLDSRLPVLLRFIRVTARKNRSRY
ncbi:hypothetical protein BD410DRAFT_842920 [Rickenella mellea]|uniref:S-adenosyl-L-methionine-dependent methyltransferase n=1 Tax=Rickenella mellea TaxID=50990 RepID=A0A4Y7PT82_9AGAM|nr:hypothetical protein BD410DRAFT_842920 [Rickenella mellea]